ncbi:MAG: ABC transporter ATP-binding protein [Candidatus Heimdallarchaeota archaeon]|nr:ABC transporter ATP-binding protein [Candidatus Heimdallarchaeota archaeon]
MSSDVILQVSNLTKIYGREVNLKIKKLGRKVTGAEDVSFTVNKGEIFGFLGPNGSGKTTTMRSILDYLNIQDGEITVFGLDHHKDSLAIRKRIGYVPGDMALYDNFTGNELINYYGYFRPNNAKFLKKLKKNFKVDLSLKIRALSSGNRQQVGIIAALASKPDLLILDEPTSGLDPLMTSKFHHILKQLRKEEVTIFLSSHDLAEVQSICDRVAIIKEGKIVLVEKIIDLKSKFLQNININFSKDSVPDESFFEDLSYITNIEKINDTSFKLQLKENINELLKTLSKYKIIRLTIEDANLEEIFLHYYQ